MFLAAIPWDPYLTGLLAVIVGVIVLIGSVYFLLVTNIGARLGILLSISALSGWMFLMGVLWVTYGIGWIGTGPSWEVLEVWSGDEIALDSRDFVRELPIDGANIETLTPEGWTSRDAGDGDTTDAQSAGDALVIEQLGFDGTADYTLLRGFERGGETYPEPFGWDFEPFGLLHKPHYFVTQVQANVPEAALDLNATPKQRLPNLNTEVITVVMLRDSGNLRTPAAIFMLVSLIVFVISAEQLHRRDKALMAAKASA